MQSGSISNGFHTAAILTLFALYHVTWISSFTKSDISFEEIGFGFIAAVICLIRSSDWTLHLFGDLNQMSPLASQF